MARLKFRRSGGETASVVAGALAGALAVVALFAALFAAGVLPIRREVAPPVERLRSQAADKALAARLDKIEAALAAPRPEAAAIERLSARLDRIEAALAAPRPETAQITALEARLGKIEAALAGARPDAALGTRLAAVEAATKSFATSLAAIERRLDDVAAAAKSARARADAAATTAGAAKTAAASAAQQSGAKRSDLAALAGRLAALEGKQKALVAEVARASAPPNDRSARMGVAAEALRAAVERGAPYRAELAAVQSLGASEKAVEPLKPFAATGVPSTAALAHELAALAPDLMRASGSRPSEGSFLGRLQANAEKLVRVTPIDAARSGGDDPPAIIARSNAAAARGDMAAAIAGVRRLPDAARSLAQAWMARAEAREKAVAASRQIAADALATLGKSAPR